MKTGSANPLGRYSLIEPPTKINMNPIDQEVGSVASGVLSAQREAHEKRRLAQKYYAGALDDEFSGDLYLALRKLGEAVRLGHTEAKGHLGYIYYYGRGGVPRDFHKAMLYYMEAAEEGDKESQVSLGRIYMTGEEHIQKDEVKGFYWLEQAANQAYEKAQILLGRLLIDHRKYDEGLKWLLPIKTLDGAEQYCVSQALKFTSQAQLGHTWLEKAANSGDADAQYDLGMYILFNDFIENRPEAMKWFQKAADQEHIEAQYRLGNCYESSGNPKKALKYLLPLADEGHKNSQYALAKLYSNLYHTEFYSPKLAIEWYSKFLQDLTPPTDDQRAEAEGIIHWLHCKNAVKFLDKEADLDRYEDYKKAPVSEQQVDYEEKVYTYWGTATKIKLTVSLSEQFQNLDFGKKEVLLYTTHELLPKLDHAALKAPLEVNSLETKDKEKCD